MPLGIFLINPDFIRINERIRAREVRVIIGSTGQQLGILKTDEALRRAKSYGLDLIEISPNATPPVCRITDFGKYKYELTKQERERKQHHTKVKEIKFRVKIGTHDYETKLRHAEEFLEKANKVKVQLQFRGREMAHKDLGLAMMEKITRDLDGMSTVDTPAKLLGRAITMTLSPLPANKRKRRFGKPEESFEEMEAADEAKELQEEQEDSADSAQLNPE
ncbi:MAG: translation initiation factor IF-3 [Chthoniobacterales bacterium]|nr:translation initiation factor IF-3 [Chthoniobacterales bacterium]